MIVHLPKQLDVQSSLQARLHVCLQYEEHSLQASASTPPIYGPPELKP
jgi:hypothetical protein